ncbi:hypothetical protein [Natronorubrum halophilum]|uniref:hypothetical protein n=1 Tax=Natronorubrum halophilum TaxID=1702106 RepID=UPI0013CE6F2A|nr:hypothetical protein [Natronorubrum halophilum]
MELSRTRRSLLIACGTVSALALTGCIELLDSRKLAHDVEVFNRDDIAHTLAVTVTDDGQGVLYQREFDVEGEHAEEKTDPFTGTPTTVSVAVNDGSPTTYPWPDVNCKEERGIWSVGGAKVYLTSEETVHINPSCNTVYAE